VRIFKQNKINISGLDASNASAFTSLPFTRLRRNYGFKFKMLLALHVYVIALLACDWLFESFNSKILQDFMSFCILDSWEEEEYKGIYILQLEGCSCLMNTLPFAIQIAGYWKSTGTLFKHLT